MFKLKTKQRRQTNGEALVQCSLDGFHVLGLNFGGKWKKLAETGLHGLQLLECMGVRGLSSQGLLKVNIFFLLPSLKRWDQWIERVFEHKSTKFILRHISEDNCSILQITMRILLITMKIFYLSGLSNIQHINHE